MENFIQEEFFDANLRDVRAQASKSTSEIRIPGTEISGGAEIRVVRSSRRKRSISAYREQGAIVIQVPARLSNSKVSEVIPEMVEKILSREAREKISDEELFHRAHALLAQYLPEFNVTPVSVTWRHMNDGDRARRLIAPSESRTDLTAHLDMWSITFLFMNSSI